MYANKFSKENKNIVSMSYPASVIAHFFVNKGISEGKFVTQMQLQKMVFFAHGFHLAKYKEPLIAEHFEAWKFGPVVPEIYKTFKYFGSRPITNNEAADFILDEKATDAVDYTWELTKDVNGLALSNWTHQPGTPWYNAYKPNKMSTKIDNTEIYNYFRELLTTSAT